MNLSKHFTLEEATASFTAMQKHLYNIPGPETINIMKATAERMEDVRALLMQPIHVSSWYRSSAVNQAVGSKDTSQHRLGEAVDFECPQFGTPIDICREIIKNKEYIQFDQLILEHGWVHISFSILNGKPRGQVLSLLTNNSYALGLTNPHGVPYKY